MKKGGFMKDALILFLITLVSGIALGAVYQITKAPIAVAQEKAKQEAYQKVFPAAASFEATDVLTAAIETSKAEIETLPGSVFISEAVTAKDATGNVIGHVITSSSKEGFGGEVKVSVGITSDGTVNGIEFLTLAETAGLGMKAKDDKFKNQFNRQTPVEKFEVVKTDAVNDGDIQAISGATITSNATTNAVNAAVYFADHYAK